MNARFEYVSVCYSCSKSLFQVTEGRVSAAVGAGGAGVGRKPVWREVFANLQSGVSLALTFLYYEQCRSRLI